MPFSDAIRIGAAGAAGDFEIERSVRFDRASNHHLKNNLVVLGTDVLLQYQHGLKEEIEGLMELYFMLGLP